MSRILVVERDGAVAERLADALSIAGHDVRAVLALRLGADDHIAGPVRVLEFLARVEALLRRAAWSARARERVSPR